MCAHACADACRAVRHVAVEPPGLWWFVPVFVTAGLTTRSQSHGRGLHVPLFLSCKQTGVCHVGGLL